MTVLVTGANGFVGRHLISELRRAGHAVVATDRGPSSPEPDLRYVPADVTDGAALDALLRDVRPDACVHLAGLAAPAVADQDPALAYEVNTLGTVRLLSAVRRHAPSARVLVVTSALVYGPRAGTGPLSEREPLQPTTLYAATKAAADQATLLLGAQGPFHFMTARPTNHIGPGQSTRFVVAAFARQLADIRRGAGDPRLRVGNLDSRRDFLDVRDVARAYRLLIERGRPATAYNIARGRTVAVRNLLETLCRLSGVQADIEVDPARYRPTDHAAELDTSRIRADTGWRPEIALDDALADVVAAVGNRG